jgi:hypothetical protein
MAANSLATIRNKILTSLYGRRFGILNNEFLGGQKGMVNVITQATSDTTGTNLPNHGIVELVTSTDDSWTLSDPVAGATVTLKSGSTSTGIKTVLGDNATFRSSGSSTGPDVVLTGNMGAITLYGESTAIWAPISRYGTTAQVSVSTA